jgi:hypothetical protein
MGASSGGEEIPTAMVCQDNLSPALNRASKRSLPRLDHVPSSLVLVCQDNHRTLLP